MRYVVSGQYGWIPQQVDPNVPSMARAYDYLLGGAHNFAADREVANAAESIMPGARRIARSNRSFLRRAVQFLVESGVRQFLDIGSGIPTVGNVHEIAQDAEEKCQVVYVDKDPIAVAHSELLLAGNPRARVIQADIRDIDAIFDHPHTQRLLNFNEPVGLLTVMMLHFVPNAWNPAGLLAQYRQRLCSGSYLVLSHVTADQRPDQITEAARMIKKSNSIDQLSFRNHEEVVAFFNGFELAEPGVVGCGLWRPSAPGDVSDDYEDNVHVYAGVGRKP